MNDPNDKSTDRLMLGEATIDDGPPVLAGSGMASESSLEASSILEKSRIAFLQQSRIALLALKDGTIAHLDADTQATLRTRLRLASLVLFVGFAVFLVKFVIDFGGVHRGTFLLAHAGITAVLGLVCLIISYSSTNSLLRLRSAELVIFGLPMFFFLAAAYVELSDKCSLPDEAAYFSFRDGPWLVLMFTYALFIPNPFRRAAVIIGIIALSPVVLFLVLMIVHQGVWDVVIGSGSGDVIYYTMILVLCAAGSVFGVQTIDTLRHEAYEARQLGQYRLTELIGEGGMGKVFKAEHQLLKRPCVVKLISPDKAGDAKVLKRFQREVRSTSKLTHWNTVEIYDYGSTSEGVFYYVMEYLPGLSLSEIVKRFGPMPPERVIHVLQQACDALSEAHAAKLIHRDIKPGNIFLAERGGVNDVAKLLDFGLVKPLMDAEADAMHLTTEGSIIGSPLYMSPEQAEGGAKTPDARSDIYSMGAVTYCLLTGEAPFQNEGTPVKVIMAHVGKEPEPPSKHRADIPADLEKVVMKCLAKKLEDRYQTAAELGEALSRCESANKWTRSQADQWWQEHGQPEEEAQEPAQAQEQGQAKDRGEEVPV